MYSSRLPGFYQKSVAERLAQLIDQQVLHPGDVEQLEQGGLDLSRADTLIENVIGVYRMPIGLATNFLIDGEEYLIPMCIEEPSVVAAASRAALLVREGGGFHTQCDPPVMIGQILLLDIADFAQASTAIRTQQASLLETANRSRPSLVARGGGAVGLEVRMLDDHTLVVHLLVDCRDAMGANIVNGMCEALAPTIAALAGGRVGMCILSNLADHRLCRVRAQIPIAALATHDLSGETAAQRIAEGSLFAQMDPYRACTHNKGIFNGIDAVMIATGNDWRGIEAGGHTFAAQTGSYQPLSAWDLNTPGFLTGTLQLPMAVGVVGGTLSVHPGAQLALRILGSPSGLKLASIAASAGLATNLAAVRALTGAGIQQAHMPLHHRATRSG